MKLSTKRLLMVFSVCLNVGCVIALALMLFSGKPPTHDQRRKELIDSALDATDLAADKKEAILTKINAFFEQAGDINKEIRRAKLDQMRLLAGVGEVDQGGMRMLEERINGLQNRRNDLAVTDMLDLRRDLGERNSMAFFGLLVSRIEEKMRSR